MKTTIVAFVLQGQPLVLLDDEFQFDPARFDNLDSAEEAVERLLAAGHVALTAASSIVVLDVLTGDCNAL